MKINQNEITGAYYEKKTPWLTMFFQAIAGIVTGLVLADFIFEAEQAREALLKLTDTH